MAQMVKNLPAMPETQVEPGEPSDSGFLNQEDPLEESRQSTPVSLPGESMDRGAWWAAVHQVANSWAPLSNQHFHFHCGLPTLV